MRYRKNEIQSHAFFGKALSEPYGNKRVDLNFKTGGI